MTEDEMVGWHLQLNAHEFEQTPGDSEGQGSLMCCSPRGLKESDTTEGLNNNPSLLPSPTKGDFSLFPSKSVYSLLFFLAFSWLILLLDIFLGPPSTCNAPSFPQSQVFSLFKLNLQIGLHMLLLFSNFNLCGCPFLSPTTKFWLCESEVGPRS